MSRQFWEPSVNSNPALRTPRLQAQLHVHMTVMLPAHCSSDRADARAATPTILPCRASRQLQRALVKAVNWGNFRNVGTRPVSRAGLGGARDRTEGWYSGF